MTKSAINLSAANRAIMRATVELSQKHPKNMNDWASGRIIGLLLDEIERLEALLNDRTTAEVKMVDGLSRLFKEVDEATKNDAATNERVDKLEQQKDQIKDVVDNQLKEIHRLASSEDRFLDKTFELPPYENGYPIVKNGAIQMTLKKIAALSAPVGL